MTAPVSTWVSLTTDGKEEFREMAFFLGKDQQFYVRKPSNELWNLLCLVNIGFFQKILFQ